jgi:DNA-binding NtrC family response regulator
MSETNDLSNVLIVEDNVHFVNYLRDRLAKEYNLSFAENAEIAMQMFQSTGFELVLLDLGLPRRNGMPPEVLGFELLKRIKALDPTTEVIVLTATTREIDSAVRAIKEGAYHFIIKDDFEAFDEKLRTSMNNALQKRRLERSNRALLKQAKFFAELQKRLHRHFHPELDYHFGLLLGESPGMQEIYTMIEKVSTRQPNETVLIQGEPGTGKELVALSIHAQSPRGDRPWIVANIASLPPQLVESELFGINARTATGVGEKVGYFEQADGTSIFLDEVSEVPPDIQVKMLRVLQQKQIQRVGSTKPIDVDARVIAATNRDLKELVEQKAFRDDLYFRLDVISITLPPLRERRDDIPILIKHAVHGLQQEESNPSITLAPDAIALLQEYHWPGNIRQLENVLKKAAVRRNEDLIQADELLKLLPDFGKWQPSQSSILEKLPSLGEIGTNGEAGGFKSVRDDLRHKVLLHALIDAEGSMESALDRLGVARNTAYRLLDETQNLFLAGLCHMDLQIERLAIAWAVDAVKLEKTIRRANRLQAHYKDLQKRFANDRGRLAVLLNVKVNQVEKLEAYLAALR